MFLQDNGECSIFRAGINVFGKYMDQFPHLLLNSFVLSRQGNFNAIRNTLAGANLL